jgi:hypothetical protein
MSAIWNCCTDGLEPNWASFTQLELGPIRIEDRGNGETECFPSNPDECDFWTLYGRLESGECEALHDGSLEEILAQLSGAQWYGNPSALVLIPFNR